MPSHSAPGSSEAAGLLLVDKPRGVTSHDVVAAVRSVLRIRRVGHAGTLDPMATGLLVVGFGQGTRLLRAAMGSDKTYEATIRLGVTTSTDDADGDVLRVVPVIPATRPENRSDDDPTAHVLDRDDIVAVVKSHLLGRISQVPSRYSAIRVNGRHAYDRARAGEDFVLEPREVDIHHFDVGEPTAATVTVAGSPTPVMDVDVSVDCSSGAYIRSLARDLGSLLGVGGHLVALRRVRVGGFGVAEPRVVGATTAMRTLRHRDGVTRDVPVARMNDDAEGLIRHALSPASAAARLMPVLHVDDVEARDLRFGRTIRRRGTSAGPMAAILSLARADGDRRDTVAQEADSLCMDIRGGLFAADDLVALVEPKDDGVRPVVVFPAGAGSRGGDCAPTSENVDEGEGR